MDEREWAKRFQDDLRTWSERGELPDDPDMPETYRSALATACRLAQANVEANPGFRSRLEQRLQGAARENLHRQARQTALRLRFSSGLSLGGGAVLLLALALGLSLIFNRIKPWGMGSGNTPTPGATATLGVISTELVGQVLTPAPTAIPLIPPTTVRANTFSTPSEADVQVAPSSHGDWTTYTAPEWQQKGESIMISAMTIAADGSLWAGTMGGAATIGTGIYRFDGNIWTHFTDQNGVPFMEVNAIAAAPDNTLWFATSCCGLSHFDGKNWTTYTTDSGLPSNDIRTLTIAPDGSLWLGTEDKGVVRFDGKSWQNYTMERDGLWGNTVTQGGVMPDGSLLFSTNTSWPYLSRFDGQSWSQYAPKGGPVDNHFYTADIATAPDHSLWFATSGGVYRLKDGVWTNYTTQDGLASDQVLQVEATSDGALWFGTDSGLSRFDGNQWTTFTTQDGLASDWISSLVAGPNGSLWVGTPGGISHYAPTASSLAQATQAACQTTTYVVEKGDTLSYIAQKFNIAVGTILDYNHADASNPGSLMLAVGDKLTIPLCAQVQNLGMQTSHDILRQRIFNPTWRTMWVQGRSATYTSTGIQNNTYLQGWLNRLDGSGRVLSTDTIPGNLGFTLDMDPRFGWVSDGKTITSFEAQSGQPAALPQGIMYPFDQANPVLGVIFPSFLAIRSEDLQTVRMDQQAGRTALVAVWANYRIWIDAQTGVLLRSQTRDQAGQITQDAQVTAIAYDLAIPAAELNTDQLSQARFEPAPAGASTGASNPDTSQSSAGLGPIVFSASTDLGTELFSMGPSGTNYVQLTHDNANNVSPACSKDGKRIAFTSIRGGQSAIYLIGSDGSGETHLIDNPSSFVDLAFSPDGTKVAFVSEQDGNPEIYVVAIDGTGLTRLTDNPAVDDSPSWSPDGTQIAFASNRDGPYQIYVMASNGGGQTNLSNSGTNDLQPAWSPDGSKIAFTSSERVANSTESEIYVMLRDGSAVAALTIALQGDLGRQYYNPAWSPDGKWMAYLSEQVGLDGFVSHKGIFEMPSDGSGLIGLQIQYTSDTWDVTGRPCWLPAAP